MDRTPNAPTSLPTPKLNRGIKGFFAEISREMKKVTWPPHKETNRLTGIVLAVCGLVVVILTAMHFAADMIISAMTKGF